MEKNQILSAAEVCEILSISPITLWRLRRAGQISFRRVASKVIFTTQDLAEFLERSKTSASSESIDPRR